MNFQFKNFQKILLLLALFFALPISVSAATPTISNVSGTVANGQTLTIAGTNMIQENTANWIRTDSAYDTSSATVLDETYFNASDCTGTFTTGQKMCSLGWYFDNAASSPENTATFDTSFYLLGSKSVRLNENNLNCIQATSCGADALEHVKDMSTTAPWYVSSYANYHGSFSTHYEKFYLGCNAGICRYLDYGNNSDSSANGFNLKNGGESGPTNSGGFPWTTDQWHYWELKVDPTTSPGDTFTIWWDGKQVSQYTFNTHSGGQASFSEVGVPNWSELDGGTLSPVTVWINRYAFSTSEIYPASVVEISGDGGSTWTYQIPTHLSDMSSAITANLPTLTAASYKLRVTNNQQQTSAMYNLTGTQDTTPPAAPQGLSVS